MLLLLSLFQRTFKFFVNLHEYMYLPIFAYFTIQYNCSLKKLNEYNGVLIDIENIIYYIYFTKERLKY